MSPKSTDEIIKERDQAVERAVRAERTAFLLRRGVPDQAVDFCLFQIGKLAGPEGDFETAAGEYLARQAAPARLDTAAPLAGGRPAAGPNEMMNALIRGARK